MLEFDTLVGVSMVFSVSKWHTFAVCAVIYFRIHRHVPFPLCEVVTLLASTAIPWVLAYVPWVHLRVGMGTTRMKTF